ncbi:MAG TPA: hypothetical protein DCL54_13665 [Alphaproteobacteria bacterium]|nr:hypothetical protein [Alphaproteobacteria bacterium]
MNMFVVVLLALAGIGSASAASVPVLRETPPVGASGDAADDPAIWVGPTPAMTRIIGTQKQGGLYVYDLQGRIVQELPGGRPNNIDLRATPKGVRIVTSDRSENALVIYALDETRGLIEAAPLGRVATGFAEVYGVCLGPDRDGTLLAVATSKIGEVGVWRLGARAGEAQRLGGFALGSIAEGCVVDDRTGVAYVAQEDVGIWRFALGLPNGEGRRLIDQVKPQGRLAADIEGLAVWRRGARGYLVASVQGENRFVVYDLDTDNTYRGSMRLVGRGGVDGVSGTDGIEVTAQDLGPGLSRGLLVVQDDENTNPNAAQNFKYVSWGMVERALGLRGRR